MLAYLLIGIGSALGGMARYFVSGAISSITNATFPYGTMVVNVTSAIVIGFFATLTGPDGRLPVGTSGRQFVMVGICRRYTTFSSFSLETLNRARDGEWLPALANAIFSVLLCLVAVWLGHICAQALNRLEGV